MQTGRVIDPNPCTVKSPGKGVDPTASYMLVVQTAPEFPICPSAQENHRLMSVLNLYSRDFDGLPLGRGYDRTTRSAYALWRGNP